MKNFSRLTKQQKQVAIAKDVISRINTNQYKAKNEQFAYLENQHQCDTQSIQKYIHEGFKCEVCAKGGLFLSYIGFVNKFNIYDMDNWHGYDIHSKEMARLSNVFPRKQLSLIETAFEKRYVDGINNSTIHYSFKLSPSEVSTAVKFGKKYRGNKSRLIAICENIIKNKGTFKPTIK